MFPYPSVAAGSGTLVQQQVKRIISQRKHVRVRQLRATASLTHDLHFDLVDVVGIILELERAFQLTIPDEVPLHTVGDLVSYVGTHQLAAAHA